MLPANWRPFDVADMLRVGSKNDGGYVIPETAMKNADALISMGLETDWAFEEDYRIATGGQVDCYDHTVTRRFWITYTLRRILHRDWGKVAKFWQYRKFFAQVGVEHHQKAIGFDNADSTSLDNILDSRPTTGEILLKVDIEGWEYRIFDQMVTRQERFTGIILECHDVDLHRDRITQFITKLNHFRVVWVHGNNYGGIDGDGDPIVVELVLCRDKYLNQITPGETRSEQLTTPNNPSRADLPLRFA